MADYIVTSGELTTVANAIREKNGTSGSLSWPDGFVSGIGSGGSSWQTVFEGSVTTENTDDGVLGNINYESVIDADKIKVTFNGTEYECDKITTPVGNAYGGIGESGPDFSEYPFAIMSGQGLETAQTIVYTETAGTYTLKIEEPQSGGSSDFIICVDSASLPLKIYLDDIAEQEPDVELSAGMAQVFTKPVYCINLPALHTTAFYGDLINMGHILDNPDNPEYFKVEGDLFVRVERK